MYSSEEREGLTYIRNAIEQLSKLSGLGGVFLYSVGVDRKGDGKSLYDSLSSRGISIRYKEKNPKPGDFLQDLEEGLTKSKIVVVLVTGEMLRHLQTENIDENKLSELLSCERIVLVLRGVSKDKLRSVNSLLGSRAGIYSDVDKPMRNAANKLIGLLNKE